MPLPYFVVCSLTLLFMLGGEIVGRRGKFHLYMLIFIYLKIEIILKFRSALVVIDFSL